MRFRFKEIFNFKHISNQNLRKLFNFSIVILYLITLIKHFISLNFICLFLKNKIKSIRKKAVDIRQQGF